MPTKNAALAKPQGCTNLKLMQLSRRVARLYDADVRALGLKHTQYALLSYVVRQGAITQAALAQAIGLQPSTITRNLQPLLAQGWLQVHAGSDARSHQVVATARGVQVRAQAQVAWKQSQLALNQRLGNERVQRLHALLDECVALLDEPDPAHD
jgi:DNA-binding MarR family transcriptional regulator